MKVAQSTKIRLIAPMAMTLISMFSTACKDPIVLPDTKIVAIPVIVTPNIAKEVPEGERIVIANVEGECADVVKDALMGRLIDNDRFDVLSRDNLEQILVETDQGWAGRFNTETAAKLGNLLGASKFIVGRVIYCGPALSDFPEDDDKAQYKIIAAVQVVDIETGKVLASSSSEGTYVPRPIPSLFPKVAAILEEVASPTEGKQKKRKRRKGFMKRVKKAFKETVTDVDESTSERNAENEGERKKNEEAYAKMKAAEDLANGFADKFFSRPMWEKVEMWTSNQWNYGDSVRHVKLGRCKVALQLLRNAERIDLPKMPDLDIAKYLHNYGVALLCDNNPREAMGKFHAAYRVASNATTLKMLGLAGRVQEWNLNVEVNTEPLVDYVLERSMDCNELRRLGLARGQISETCKY